jgi:hypothetical protein
MTERKVGRFDATDEVFCDDAVWALYDKAGGCVVTVFVSDGRHVVDFSEGVGDFLSAEDLRAIAVFIDELNGEAFLRSAFFKCGYCTYFHHKHQSFTPSGGTYSWCSHFEESVEAFDMPKQGEKCFSGPIVKAPGEG